VTNPVHAAGGGDTANALATLSRQPNERHPLALIPFLVLIPGVVDLCRPLLAVLGAKFPCSQRRRWIFTNVFLSGCLYPGYLSWYKRPATIAKPYVKCI
jgi:hypothetical protein